MDSSMDLNNAMRTSSSSECSSLTSQFLGTPSVGVHLSDGDGGGGPPVHYENNNNPTHNSGRRTSRVWKYFRMVDNCHYVCCLCNFVGAYTNTTNMRKHIQNHHPEIFQDILDHTRPSNRLHFLRSFQPQLFQSPSSGSPQFQQPYLNTGQSFHLGSNSGHTLNNSNNNNNNNNNNDDNMNPIGHIPQYADPNQPNGGIGGEEGDSSSFAVPPCTFFPSRDHFGAKNMEHPKNPTHFTVSKSLCKTETKSDVFVQSLGEDRKGEVGSLGAGNVVPGLNESSAGSGEGQGGCDEVSVPLSPEQFLSEEMEQGTSPPTPSSQRPESYKLRHNNHLSLVLESLAGDESFMDVTLTAQGKAIKAHKSVLSAVSPYFRSVLKENPCQHPIIIMPRDIRFEELSNIISYVYKGEMTVAAEDLSSLLKTAEILQVTGLSPSDTSSGTSGIISQMQGLPSGMFTNTSSNSSSSKTGSKKSSKQIHHQTQQLNEEMSQTAISAEGRIDPLEFLNADMTCVKEEITSENEETQDSNFPVSMDPSGSVQSITNESVGVLDSSDTPPIHHRNRHKSVGSPKSLEDPTSKPFNPGETGVSPDEGHSESSPQMGHYACPHCLEIHRPSDALHSHLRLKHPSKPSFVCACGRVFVRQSLLMDHGKKCKF